MDRTPLAPIASHMMDAALCNLVNDGHVAFATMIIKDNLKKNSSTTIKFTDMKFNVDFEAEVFSQRWLKRR